MISQRKRRVSDMFNKEDLNEVIMGLDKDYILNNVQPAMENINSYKPKSSLVPTDNRFTKDMKGVAVIPYLPLMEDKDGRASAVITYDVLDHFGIGVQELYDNAYENLNAESSKIRALSDVLMNATLEGIIGDGEDYCIQPEELSNEPGDLYYVTNKSAFRGAMSIFSNDTYKRIGKAIGDYYIIPSSIHELLIVSAGSIEASFIADMVKSVNASGIVADKDILCDDIFKYDSDSKKVVTVELSEGRGMDQEADIGK